MSKYYLTGNTDAIKTLRTARGHHWVKAALQSFDGSVLVEMQDVNGEPYVTVRVAGGSTTDGGRTILAGPLSAL